MIATLASADVGDTGAAAARALHVIHSAIAALAGPGNSGAPLARLGRHADELEAITSASLERADHVKAGLEAAVQAIRTRAEEVGAEWLSGWTAAATQSVGAIEASSPMALQRARVQDAFRSVADTILVARQFGL